MASTNPFLDMVGYTEPEEPEAGAIPEPEPSTAVPEQPPEPELPKTNPFLDMVGYEEPEPEIVTEPEEPGTFANLWAGLKKRATGLLGDVAGFAQTTGQNLEKAAGVLDWVPQLGGIYYGPEGFDFLNAQEWQEYSQRGGDMILRDVQESLQAIDYGFTPNAAQNWELMKSSPDFIEKASALGAFALETGVISLADMAGAVLVPAPYLVARSEEIGQERAVSQGRPGQPTPGDMSVGFATASIITAMERFGFEQIAAAFVRGGSATQKILRGVVGEGGTEFIQEQLEYGAETLDTPVMPETWDEYWMASLERGAMGFAGGAPVGGVIAGAGVIVGPEETISPDIKTLEENEGAIDRALAEQVETDEQRALREAEEMRIAQNAEEMDAQEQRYKSAAHAEVKRRQLEKKYGQTGLEAILTPEGDWALAHRGRASIYQLLREREERDVGLRPAEEGVIEVEEIPTEVVTEPAPTTEGIEVGEEVVITEPAPTTEGIEVTEEEIGLIPEPTARRIAVREEVPEEIDITEPAPTTEGIEVEEVTPEEPAEGLPQIGVQEITEEEAGIEQVEAPRKIYPGREEPAAPAEAPVAEPGVEPEPITPRILSGAIKKGRKPRKGIKSDIEDTRAQLASFPQDITDLSVEETNRLEGLRKQLRDLTDEQEFGVTPEEAKQARTELKSKALEEKVSIGRFDTIGEIRRKLGQKKVAKTRDAAYERAVNAIAEAEEAGEAVNVQMLQQKLGFSADAAKRHLDRYNAEIAEAEVTPEPLEAQPGQDAETDFYNKYQEKTTPHPLMDGARILMNPAQNNPEDFAILELEAWSRDEGGILVNTIQSSRTGRGNGNAAVDFLIDLSNEHGVALILDANAYGELKGRLTQEQLVDWYTRKGFEPLPDYDGFMIYRPRGRGAEMEVAPEPGPEPEGPGPGPGPGPAPTPEAAAEAMAAKVEPGREPTDAEAQAVAFDFIEENPEFTGLKLSHKPGDERNGENLIHYYGDIDQTRDADGDPVDVILSQNWDPAYEYPIFVVNMVNEETGDFEQHKVMAGFDDILAAETGFSDMYSEEQFDDISEIKPEEFRAFIKSRRPLQPFDRDQFRTDMNRAADLAKPAPVDTVVTPEKMSKMADGAIDHSPWLLADGSIVLTEGDHLGYAMSRGMEAVNDQDLRAISEMQLEAGGVRSAFFFDEKENTNVAWLHLHEDQSLTEAQINAIEKYIQASKKAGKKGRILIGSTPSYVEGVQDYNPVVKKETITGLRRDWGARRAFYRENMRKFYAELADKSAKFSMAAMGRLRAALMPDPTRDDLITFLRKHGGINVLEAADYRERLSHLNSANRMPGLPGIEQTNGTGLTLSQAAEVAAEGNYILPSRIGGYDEDALIEKLDQAEMGTLLYSDQNEEWLREEWDAEQERYREEYEQNRVPAEIEAAKSEAENLSEVDEEMAELIARAEMADQSEAERIAESRADDETVKQQLRDLINEREGKRVAQPEGPAPAEEVAEEPERVEAEARAAEDEAAVPDLVREPEQAPDARDYEYIEEYPWQQLARAANVEILEPPSPDMEGPRTFVIDVYSDVNRTQFVRQVFAANFFRYRDVETAFLARMGPFRARLQERDEFIEITKNVQDNDNLRLHYHILDGDLTKPYRNLVPIERIQTDERKDKQERPVQGSGWLTVDQWNSTAAQYIDDLMAEPDERDVVKHWGEEFKKGDTPRDYISHEEGRKQIAEWEAHAKEVGRKSREGEYSTDNGRRIILSLFDDTLEWAQPWIDAGYDVRAIDLKRDDVDIMDIDYGWLLNMGFLEGPGIWGILAACPCTEFAEAGRRDWKPGKERPSAEGGKDFIGMTHRSVDLVNQTLSLIDFLKPRFWALENPLGRIADVTGTPTPRLSFNPNNYGDPYTKKTRIHGNFNANLPTANVDPREKFGGEGSKSHKLGSKDEKDGGLRSVTPKGFAYAFFMANNDADYPITQEISDQAVRTLDPKIKEEDPNIERKVELLVQLALSRGQYPSRSDLEDGTVNRYDDAYRLEETDRFPKWAKALISEMDSDMQEDWRLDDGAILTRRELNHMDSELRDLLGVGQKKAVQFPQKEQADYTPIESLSEIPRIADQDLSYLDPVLTEAAIDAINIAMADLAEQGYTYNELAETPIMQLPNYLADPMSAINDVASGAVSPNKGVRGIVTGDKRFKNPDNILDRIFNYKNTIEQVIGEEVIPSSEFKAFIQEEYPQLAKALDDYQRGAKKAEKIPTRKKDLAKWLLENRADFLSDDEVTRLGWVLDPPLDKTMMPPMTGEVRAIANRVKDEDPGVAMRRQLPGPEEQRRGMYESVGRDDLAWGPQPEPEGMTEEEIAALPQPEEPVTERGPEWEAVEEAEMPPVTDIGGVLDASTEGEAETSLADIPLTAESGERTVTHNANWWRNAIDTRLKKLNKIRGCA